MFLFGLFQFLFEFLTEFLKFRADDILAVTLIFIIAVIILMIIFRSPEFWQRANLGYNRVVPYFRRNIILRVFGFLFLVVIKIEYHRAVLLADIRALTV